MNGYMLTGMLVGVVVGLIIVAILLKVTKKDGDIKCKYDERQTFVRGTGFKISFFILMIYDAIYGMLSIVLDKPFMDPMVAMMIGICLAVAVYAIYCIWFDAYISLNENPKKVLAAFGIIAIVNLGFGGTNLIHGTLITDGMLNFRSTNLVCGLLFIVIFIAFLAKRMKNSSEVE